MEENFRGGKHHDSRPGMDRDPRDPPWKPLRTPLSRPDRGRRFFAFRHFRSRRGLSPWLRGTLWPLPLRLGSPWDRLWPIPPPLVGPSAAMAALVAFGAPPVPKIFATMEEGPIPAGINPGEVRGDLGVPVGGPWGGTLGVLWGALSILEGS